MDNCPVGRRHDGHGAFDLGAKPAAETPPPTDILREAELEAQALAELAESIRLVSRPFHAGYLGEVASPDYLLRPATCDECRADFTLTAGNDDAATQTPVMLQCPACAQAFNDAYAAEVDACGPAARGPAEPTAPAFYAWLDAADPMAA